MWYLIGMGVSFFFLSLYLHIYASKYNIKKQYNLNDNEAIGFYLAALLVMAMFSSLWPMIFISFISFETFILLKKWNKIPK